MHPRTRIARPRAVAIAATRDDTALSLALLAPILLLVLLGMLALAAPARADDSEIGCVTTEWKLLGANHQVCVFAFQDPRIPGVSCFISQAKTGGISGSLGLAEDPSNFSVSCSQTGPITIPDKLPAKENVFKESTSVFFKATRVTRLWDKQRNTLVYLAVSRKIIDGSPYNSVSTVPVRP
ncbi:CreA family protein [Nitratidesulfovibrio sp. HK-II]|jgi:CreA protein|nr:CreA family protein [Nitratidesulfovibrio sp. HK-II]GBO95113.1 conserved uncharacterized protein CreA [Nitratidesulfovibrio sp. HK-II]